MNTDIILLIVAVLISFSLFGIVVRKGKIQTANNIFGLFILSVVFWMVSNYLANNPAGHPLFWTRMTFVGSSVLAFILLNFAMTFPDNHEVPKFKVALLGLPCAGIIYLLFTPYIIKDITIIPTGTGVAQGSLYLAYFMFFLGYVVASLVILIKKYLTSRGIQRTQLLFLFIGLAGSLLLGTMTNLIIPFLLKNDTLSSYGTFAAFIFIGFASYAIIKHHLLEAKIIITEVATVIVVVSLFIQAMQSIFSNKVPNSYVSSVVFIAVAYGGYILVRSVLEETKKAKEVESVNRQLEKDKKDLVELDRMKDEFLQMATHELNTPITVIQGKLDMGIRENMCKLDDEQKAFFQPILDNTTRLAHLSADVLNTARIDQHRLKINTSETDMDALLSQIVSGFEIKTKEKGNSIAYIPMSKTLPKLTVDQSKIGEVATNLITNANKFTENGKIAVTSKLRDDMVIISVADTGIGIDKEDQKHLFEKFYQVGRFDLDDPQEQQGSGLGLYISKNIIKLHGGDMWLESEKGKGSTFYFSLPLEYKEVKQSKVIHSDGLGLRVL